jgi:hypothetical protein
MGAPQPQAVVAPVVPAPKRCAERSGDGSTCAKPEGHKGDHTFEVLKDYCVGLRKVGPSQYRVVQLTAQGERVLECKVDYLDQDLEHSARTILLCLKQLVGRID